MHGNAPLSPPADDHRLDATFRKVTLGLVPYIFACYLFNYLDRVNVGFAKLDMLDSLHMTERAYGLAAGIFFLGYIACGVPSNLMLQRVGARRWLALIMIVWGALSAAQMFVRGPASFYALRLATGAAESGFFPGLVLYLTRWFPSARHGRVLTLFMAAIPLSGVIGGPLSGWMLGHFAASPGGIAAWQWLFLLQGLPTVLLGIGMMFLLSDTIGQVRWLTAAERAAVQDALDRDRLDQPPRLADSFGAVLRNPAIWMLGLLYFCTQAGVYAINFWLPSIIRTSGVHDPAAIGWLSAIPYLAATIFMILMGRSADRRRERRWHLAIPLLMAAAGLAVAARFPDDTPVALAALTVATAGALTGLPMFWPLCGGYLSPAAAAGGLALINSMGQMAGFVSPYLVGWVKDMTHRTDGALYLLAGLAILGVTLVLRMSPARVNR
ncbi:major facilitator superfamily MFS_1 [Gluconacetobacter diazotrophicus PA1 5]|uniref:Putative tartrate transporter n=2 Tax=Gluconacetobacter diazotrophicus TaxID=33996 RepID=A9H8R6_GLUDA|nr:MFS transporter [Gluconacetobacter diazotrophicus]ACI51162.1 major facilitator superfamily MFS_1 [Gluconacetobacter diazotrophicus PA1 5]MBB2155124.1 MFS transporter [Gluconacetobacter diazotrophicus]TWB07561.1 sugar phosphate permease [Gluconacetobacter diazotrophicus]CAP54567.1 putative transporter protein [Gluconacetobacter diazotrophicus PA1 5]